MTNVIFCVWCLQLFIGVVSSNQAGVRSEYSEEDTSVNLRWPLIPQPSSDDFVTVLNNNGDNLFVFSNRTIVIHPSFQHRLRVDMPDDFSFINFTLHDVSRTDAGTYFTSRSGNETPGIILVILGIPDIPTVTAVSRPILNHNHFLNCSTNSNSLPPTHGIEMKYKWDINCKTAGTRGRYSYNGSQFSIKPLTMEDNGCNVTCAASEISAISEESTTHRIDLLFPPQSVPLLPRRTRFRVLIGEELPDFQCNAECNPECHFAWYNKNNLTSRGRYLMLDEMTRSKTGEYYCTAQNIYGIKSSKTLYINTYNLTITLNETHQCIRGETITLLCSVNIDEDFFTFLPWVREGNDTELKEYKGTRNGKENILTIHSCDDEDGGIYVCSINASVYNEYQTRVAITNLTILSTGNQHTLSGTVPTIVIYIGTGSAGCFCSFVLTIIFIRLYIKHKRRKAVVIQRLKLQMEMTNADDSRSERPTSPREYEEIYDDAEVKESDEYHSDGNDVVSDVESIQTNSTDKSSYEELHNVNRCPAYDGVEDGVNKTELENQAATISSDNDSNMADDENSNSHPDGNSSSSSSYILPAEQPVHTYIEII